VSQGSGSPEKQGCENLDKYEHPELRIKGQSLQGLLQGMLGLQENASVSLSDFYLYAEVQNGGFDIVRAHFLDSANVVLEDTVQNGLILFWSDQKVVPPGKVELYDRSGELVYSQAVLKSFGDIVRENKSRIE
jgi:hypothetical protein